MNHFSGAKYSQVGNSIIQKIEDGIYKTGEAIPSERELIEYFNVSRITIRKAIDELVAKGFLTKVQGKGTYVKSGIHRQNLFSLTSCKNDIEKQGMVPSTKIIDSRVEEVNEEIAKSLKLDDKDLVFTLERVYYADGIPVNYTTTHLPLKLFPDIDKIDFHNKSLYETLESKYGVKLIEATRTIEAAIPNDQIASVLDLSPNMPVLLFKATTIADLNGMLCPIENFICNYRTDMFKFYITQVNSPNI
ncbi:MAG: GntR family transcriptional regulator [Sphaerochaetaceae bacterium]|nr:GntR family transcriptional regulator [Sphaerochaetaceae bacterium]